MRLIKRVYSPKCSWNTEMLGWMVVAILTFHWEHIPNTPSNGHHRSFRRSSRRSFGYLGTSMNIRKSIGVTGMCYAHRSVADRSHPWTFSWPAPQELPYANNGEFTAIYHTCHHVQGTLGTLAPPRLFLSYYQDVWKILPQGSDRRGQLRSTSGQHRASSHSQVARRITGLYTTRR